MSEEQNQNKDINDINDVNKDVNKEEVQEQTQEPVVEEKVVEKPVVEETKEEEKETTPENQDETQDENDETQEKKHWYVVHTQTGHEDKIRDTISSQAVVHGVKDKIFKVLVPTEEVVEIKQNKKNLRTRKFFPGYLLIQMNLTNESYWFIKNISGVAGFLGDPHPTQLDPSDIEGIEELTESAKDGKPKHAVQFEKGENVRIVEGPFKHFVGVIDEVNEEKTKLTVKVTVFDRETPVDVDFLQVEKIS